MQQHIRIQEEEEREEVENIENREERNVSKLNTSDVLNSGFDNPCNLFFSKIFFIPFALLNI